MGKGAGSAPTPPDPVKTSEAQTASNIETARKQAELNRVNQVGPTGSVTYSQGGTPDQWTQTTTLSPEQQRLYDLSTRAQTTYGEVGNNQLDAVRAALSQPDTTDYGDARKTALDAQMARLNPLYAQQEEAMRSRLINQGLTEGSAGWNNAFQQFNQGRNDAYVAADLNAGNTVGQQISQTTALRSRPLNEVAALLTGQQVQTPQAYQPGNVGVAPTDVIGAYNNQYQGQLSAYNSRQQSNAAGMGGLFGLAGTLGGAAVRRYGLPF